MTQAWLEWFHIQYEGCIRLIYTASSTSNQVALVTITLLEYSKLADKALKNVYRGGRPGDIILHQRKCNRSLYRNMSISHDIVNFLEKSIEKLSVDKITRQEYLILANLAN